MSGLSADIWQPVRLTIELAAITTVLLLIVGTPIAWWLARSKLRWKEAVAAIVAMPLVLPPTVLGFYLLVVLGPDGPGGLVAGLWGARTLAFTFEGLVIGSVLYSMPFVVQPIRNAFEAIGDRPLEVAATLRASPTRAFWTVAVPLARPGFLTGAVLGFAHTVGEFGVVLMIGGNIPGKTQSAFRRDLRLCRDLAVARSPYPRRRHGGLLVRGDPRHEPDREAGGASRSMSEAGRIEAAFRGALGRFALDAAFEVPARGVTALFGASGCGKTTVLRCMAGLQRLDPGLCVVDGEVWQDEASFRPAHQRPIGYVFQEASLFPHLSVRRNLLYGTPAQGRSRRSGGDVPLDEVIDLLGLEKLLDRSPGHLSGGERQRVAIGRALLSQPKLLLMDEPLSALDRLTKDEILPFLERLHERLSLPVLYVSHDMAEIERLADHLVLMDAGRVLAAGPLMALQSDPSLPLAAARTAAVSLDATVTGYDAAYGLLSLTIEGGHFLVPATARAVGERQRLRVVANDVSLATRPPQGSSVLNILPARILTTTPMGENEIVTVLGLGEDGAGARLLARITRRSWDQLGLHEGALVHAQIKGIALAPR